METVDVRRLLSQIVMSSESPPEEVLIVAPVPEGVQFRTGTTQAETTERQLLQVFQVLNNFPWILLFAVGPRHTFTGTVLHGNTGTGTEVDASRSKYTPYYR